MQQNIKYILIRVCQLKITIVYICNRFPSYYRSTAFPGKTCPALPLIGCFCLVSQVQASGLTLIWIRLRKQSQPIRNQVPKTRQSLANQRQIGMGLVKNSSGIHIPFPVNPPYCIAMFLQQPLTTWKGKSTRGSLRYCSMQPHHQMPLNSKHWNFKRLFHLNFMNLLRKSKFQKSQ